jgi:hypothetical protein
VIKADERLRKSWGNGNAAIVKAAPKLRQHFCLFLRVDRDRADGNRGLSPVAQAYCRKLALRVSLVSMVS